MNSKIGLIADQLMKYGIVQFLLYEYLEESPNCIYILNIHCLLLKLHLAYVLR